jgi:hypothetical protein
LAKKYPLSLKLLKIEKVKGAKANPTTKNAAHHFKINNKSV